VDLVRCQTLTAASGITYCIDQIGTDAQIGIGETPDGVDAYVKNTFYQNINNTLVFANGTLNPDCGLLYKKFLCDSSFPACGTAARTGLRDGSGSCKERCYETMAACGVTDIHSGLYVCGTYPDTCFACRMSVMSMIASLVLPLLMAFHHRL